MIMKRCLIASVSSQDYYLQSLGLISLELMQCLHMHRVMIENEQLKLFPGMFILSVLSKLISLSISLSL